MIDAIAIVKEALKAHVPEVPFSTVLPDPAPTSAHVLGWVQSATDTDFLYRPQVALVCWGTSDASAMALAMDCARAVELAAQTHPRLSAASVASLSRDTFTPGGCARYRLLLNLIINK
ncbi:hypothetical protein AAK684_03355 [Leptogranulimonas caecicola]|uniref:DUF3168 domain-containing protein n=1 Tax=Leptogranulimonas caecicola TaxID=2894156 RepID=A0AAU9CLP4_9ACTN|nr:hypothetical protein [Leptogranulimonas caecicola]BDC91398.1 hypothetical protein ATTO_12700 [Leptogranulimonas caecicola]